MNSNAELHGTASSNVLFSLRNTVPNQAKRHTHISFTG